MKILICDRQRMLAEALASALDARGYDILAVTTTLSGALSSVGDWVPDVCLLGLQPGNQSSGPDTVRALLEGYPGTKVLVFRRAQAAIHVGSCRVELVPGRETAWAVSDVKPA